MPYHVTDMLDNVVRLVKAGSVVGDNKAATTQYPSQDGAVSYGGANDLWGTTWTPDEINDATTGIVLSSTVVDGVAKVNAIALAVFYSLPTNADRGAMLSVLHVDPDRSTARPRVYSLPRAGLTLANDPNLALRVSDAEFATSRFYRPSRTVQKTFTAAEFRVDLEPETNTPGFQLWASIDDAAAIQLLDADGLPATLTESGNHRLFFPAGSAGSWVQFLPTVPAAGMTQQPVRVEMRDFRVIGAVNPRARNRIHATLVLGDGEYKDLTSMRRTIAAQQDDFAALKGRVVTYQSPWGEEGYVTIERVAFREAANKNGTWSALAEIEMRQALYE